MRTIRTNAGIGDGIWLLMKLINSGERYHFELPDGQPQRGKQIFDLLPQVVESCTYVPGLSYKTVKALNITNHTKYFKEFKSDTFYLSANDHLEKGRRIEKWMPDLKTSFRIKWNVPNDKPLTDIGEPIKYIGIYSSSYSSQRNWKFWDVEEWMTLIRSIARLDEWYTFVLIGAEWDTDLSEKIEERMFKEGINYVSTVGMPLSDVINVMKQLHYFFSFPSGLGILAPTVGCDTVMFYPAGGAEGVPNLRYMINAWASPEDIESGKYKGCTFCPPEKIFQWCVDNKKL